MADLNIPVSITYSENTGNKPQPQNLEIGQLWINLADGSFGSKNSSGLVEFSLFTLQEKQQALADVTWGSITGSLSSQSDLSTALDGKADLTGCTFTGPVTAPSFNGNASTATKLATAKTITVSGDATGSASFDGSQGVTLSITVNSASALKTARSIDGVSFDGSANISHYAVCADAIDSVAKAITLSGFSLVTGATAIITFTNGNSAQNPTLNVNGSGAKAIINTGKALSTLSAGTTLMVVYDGTNYQVVGGAGGGIDFSMYYTKEEMDAKFLPTVTPTAKGTVSIYDPSDPEAQPIVEAYNNAKNSSSDGLLNMYTKEEADALFAKIVNPTIVDTLTIQDQAG